MKRSALAEKYGPNHHNVAPGQSDKHLDLSYESCPCAACKGPWEDARKRVPHRDPDYGSAPAYRSTPDMPVKAVRRGKAHGLPPKQAMRPRHEGTLAGPLHYGNERSQYLVRPMTRKEQRLAHYHETVNTAREHIIERELATMAHHVSRKYANRHNRLNHLANR